MYGFGISYHGANDTKPIWSHFVSFPITPKLADVLESCQSYLPSVFDKKQTHIGESSTNKNSFHLHLKYHSSSHCYLTRSNIHITDSSVCFINPGSGRSVPFIIQSPKEEHHRNVISFVSMKEESAIITYNLTPKVVN